ADENRGGQRDPEQQGDREAEDDGGGDRAVVQRPAAGDYRVRELLLHRSHAADDIGKRGAGIGDGGVVVGEGGPARRERDGLLFLRLGLDDLRAGQHAVEQLALLGRGGRVEGVQVALLLGQRVGELRLPGWPEPGRAEADQVRPERRGEQRLLQRRFFLHAGDQAEHADRARQRRVAAAHRELALDGQQRVDRGRVFLSHDERGKPGTGGRRADGRQVTDRGDRRLAVLLGQRRVRAVDLAGQVFHL